MLTQEDFVAPKMSAEARLQRSSWKAEAIRRGQLKISGPIPIAEEKPLTDAVGSEHADKMQTTSHVEPAKPDPSFSMPPPPAPVSTEDATAPSAVDDTSISPTAPVHGPHTLTRKTSSHSLRDKSETQATIPPPAVAYASTTPFSSLQRSVSSADTKRRRKGSIKNVFRRMFGRRGRGSSGDQTGSPRHSHHRSEPITQLQSPELTEEKRSGSRISDLHVRDLEPVNPLAQHLPFPMNVNAPQDASPRHEYINFDVQRSVLNRRRATLPTVLQSASEGNSDDACSEDQTQLPQIGIALSSPPPPGVPLAQSKRRSRSAGAMRDLAMSKARPSIERRRSAEIRYWRGGYRPGNLYTAATPRPQTCGTVETARMDVREAADVVSLIIADLESDQNPVAAQTQPDSAPSTAEVDSFDFGDLASDFDEAKPVDPMASVPREKRPSIEERVKHLEDNTQALETSVRRISGRTNRQTIILENAPRGRRPSSRDTPASSDFHSSQHSSPSTEKAHSTQAQHYQPTSTSPPVHQPEERPIDTQNPTPDKQTIILDVDVDSLLPPSAQPPTLDVTQQLSLITQALKIERTSRQALQSQIDRLQREVTHLHAIVRKLAATSTAYPTPSPDTIITCANDERLSTPRAPTHPLRAFAHDDDDDDADAAERPGSFRRIRQTVISRFSQSDSETASTASDASRRNSASSSKGDVTSPEAETWATPLEEGFASGSGFFHEPGAAAAASRSREGF